MGIRFSHKEVKNRYKEKKIELISNYRNLFKLVNLKCKLCEFSWNEVFNPSEELKCPKCNSEEKIQNTEKVGGSGSRRRKLKINN